jgi:ubiquitin conjugation factor E4 A
MDTSGDNDFSLLFASREDKDAVKRRCLELIENELKKLPKSDKPDLQSLDKKLDDENSMDVHSKVDTTVDMNAGSQETSELMKAEIENALYEKIFLFTLENEEAHVTRYPVRGQKAPPCMIYLPEMADNEKSEGLACWFNTDNIDGAIIERLQMRRPEKSIVWTQKFSVKRESQIAIAAEASPIRYLAACYDRSVIEKQTLQVLSDSSSVEVINQCTRLAVSYAGSYLTDPRIVNLYSPSANHDPYRDLYDMMMSSLGYRTMGTASVGFFKELVNELKDSLETVFLPVFKQLYEAVQQLTLHRPNDISGFCSLIDFIARNSSLACVLMKSDCWLPPAQAQSSVLMAVPEAFQAPVPGNAYENSTIIGHLVGLTCIPQFMQQSEFFLEPDQQSQAEMEATTESLRLQFTCLTDSLNRILHNLLRSPDTKPDTLKWIVQCMRDNSGRKQLISSMHHLFLMYASDGFFLNLSTALLKLCEPFTSLTKFTKLDSLIPLYCSQQANEQQHGGTTVFVFGLKEETKLSVQPPDGLPSDDVEYNFITQIFFITHRCLQIGLNQVCDHYMELMQQLAKLQQKVSEAMAVGGGVGGEVRQLFERAMTRHLAYKAQLLNPPLIESAFQFYVATAHWLTKLAVGEDIGVDSKVDMQSLKTPSIGLCYIPEFVVEDVVQFVIFVR